MKVPIQKLELIKQAIWKWSAEVPRAKDLLAEECISAISDEDANLICDILLKELLATGLDEDSEPTDRGIQLEAAIDWVRSVARKK